MLKGEPSRVVGRSVTATDVADSEYESLFVESGEAFLPSALARGPWSRDLLHGGAVAALIAHEVQRHLAIDGRFAAQLTAWFGRPLRWGRITFETECIRRG